MGYLSIRGRQSVEELLSRLSARKRRWIPEVMHA